MPTLVNTDIFIACAYFKNDFRIETNYIKPVHAGRSLADEGVRRDMSDMLGDNTGDNISHLNNLLCELTAIYWMMKNVKAEFYGLMHYRRILNINNSLGIDQLPFGHRFDPNFGSNIKNYDRAIEQCLSANDLVIVTDTRQVLNRQFSRPIFDYFNEPEQINDPINVCNLFIMKRDIFIETWSFIFDLCLSTIREADQPGHAPLASRSVGCYAEDGFGIFCNLLQKRRAIRTLRSPMLVLPEFLGETAAKSLVDQASLSSAGREFLLGERLLPGEQSFRKRLLCTYDRSIGKHESVLEYLNLLALDGESAIYHKQEYIFYLIATHQELGDYPKACACLQQTLCTITDHWSDKTLLERLIAIVIQDPEFERSLNEMLSTLEVPTNNERLFMVLYYYQKQCWVRVLAEGDRIAHHPWWLVPSYYQGISALRINDPAAAIHHLFRTMTRWPNSPEAQFSAYEMGKLTLLDPAPVQRILDGIQGLAVDLTTKSLLQLEFHRARNEHQTTIGIADSMLNRGNLCRHVQLFKGIALRKLGRLAEAARCFEAEETLFGTSAEVMVQKSILFRMELQLRRSDEPGEVISSFITMMQETVAREPLCFWVNSELGWLHEAAGDSAAALCYFEREASLQPGNAIVEGNLHRLRIQAPAPDSLGTV